MNCSGTDACQCPDCMQRKYGIPPPNLLRLVEETVACGCCTINGEATVKIVQWLIDLHEDEDQAEHVINTQEDVINDLYLFYNFDHEYRPTAISE